MSRFNDRVSGLLVALLMVSSAQAQTIGDYSRAQRAAIEASMSRTARVSPDPAPVPLPSLAATGPATAPVARAAAPTPPAVPDSGPDIVISGVVVAPARRTAEVVVDGVPFLLEVGQRVPESPWTVASIDPGKVVLARTAPARSGRTASRTFVLPDAAH